MVVTSENAGFGQKFVVKMLPSLKCKTDRLLLNLSNWRVELSCDGICYVKLISIYLLPLLRYSFDIFHVFFIQMIEICIKQYI